MRRQSATAMLSALIGAAAAALAIVIAHQSAAPSTTAVITEPSGHVAFASRVSTTTPLTPRAVYEGDADGVVAIRASSHVSQASLVEPLGGGASEGRTDTGTGIVLSATGLILTNDHVVAGAQTITVSLDGQGSHTRAATVVGADPSKDLALLRIDPTGENLHALTLAASGDAEVGEPAYAIGNPFGLNWTLTTGVVSALNRDIRAPDGATISQALQTDAPLNPGNSGGPLLDDTGAVIGINSQIVSSSSSREGAGSEGVGFAISVATVRSFLNELKVDV